MTIERHSTLTFSGNHVVLAKPYKLKMSASEHRTDCEVFLHIPKCGGTTLHFIMLSGALLRQNSCVRHIIKDIEPPVLINNGWTGAWKSAWEAKLQPASFPAYYSGHYPFGVHENIACKSHYITLLRDPVKRELSSFNHHYQKGFHSGGVDLLEKMIDLHESLDNPQVRMIAGINYMQGDCIEEVFQVAVANLNEYFALVGTVEQSSDFIQAMLALNSWPATAYVRTQVTEIKAVEKISKSLEEKIYDYHSYDKRLHELVEKRWLEWKIENVIGECELSPEDQVIYLPPDIHQSRRPHLITASELKNII